MRKLQVATLCGFVGMAVQLGGCAVSGTPIKASGELSKQNSMHKIAVLGTSRVVWPRMFGKEPVLGLEASKNTLNAVLPMLSSQFSQKGYEVTMVEGVGVYPHASYKEDWVFPAEGEFTDPEEAAAAAAKKANEKSKKKGDKTAKVEDSTPVVADDSFGKPYQLQDKVPAYVYPRFAQNSDAQSAARTVFDHIERNARVVPAAAGAAETVTPVSLPVEALTLLRTQTGADTLCFTDVQGQRFTTARKSGALAMNLVTALFGVVTIPPQDSSTVSLTCFNAEGDSVAWQNMYQFLGDPEKPSSDAVKGLLTYFPSHGQPLDALCKADEKAPTQFTCQQAKARKQG